MNDTCDGIGTGFNSIGDFCLWGPPTVRLVGDAEEEMVIYCTKSSHGTRVMPQGTIYDVYFPSTSKLPARVDFTKFNIPAGDERGELDNHRAKSNGNSIGGLVFGTGQQFHGWTNFISAGELCKLPESSHQLPAHLRLGTLLPFV